MPGFLASPWSVGQVGFVERLASSRCPSWCCARATEGHFKLGSPGRPPARPGPFGLAETHPGESRNPLVRLSSGSDRPELLGQNAAGRRRGAGSGPGPTRGSRLNWKRSVSALGPLTGVIRRSIGEGTGNRGWRRPPPAARRSWYQWEEPVAARGLGLRTPADSARAPRERAPPGPYWSAYVGQPLRESHLQGKAIGFAFRSASRSASPSPRHAAASLSRPAAASTSPVENWLWIRSVWRSSSLVGASWKSFCRSARVASNAARAFRPGRHRAEPEPGLAAPGRGCGGRTGRGGSGPARVRSVLKMVALCARPCRRARRSDSGP